MRPLALALAALLVATPAAAADPRITLLTVADNAKDGVGPHWTPTADQADEALAALIRHLDNLETETALGSYQRRDQEGVRKRFAEYRFQAFGITMGPRNIPELKGPARMVELNANCGSQPGYHDPAWSQRPLGAIDGGDCYFRAFYDVAARRIAWVSVNGQG